MDAKLYVVLLLCVSVPYSLQWTGHVCPYQTVSYVSTTICTYHCWWHCCDHEVIQTPVTTTAYKCCPGWRHNRDNNCNIAQCYPGCANGGTCTSPGNCTCRAGYTGDTCTGEDCNHERPCFPGQCTGNGASVVCNCMDDFTGLFCKELKAVQAPKVTQLQASFSYHKGQEEIYGVIADSSGKPEHATIWTNLDRLNNLTVTASAMSECRDLPAPPSYIRGSRLGISRAYVTLSGPLVTSAPSDHTCDNTVGSQDPKDIITCSVKTQYTNRLHDGDKLTITFRVSSGGFRKLYDTGSGRVTATENYIGKDTVSSVAFNIDLVEPINNDPDTAFRITPEFTKDHITLNWRGWTDANSGMNKYKWEVFKLQPSTGGALSELTGPVNHGEVKHTSPISFPVPFLPEKPGMYSFILEAVDKANNSVYMRRFALCDKESSVTTDPKYAMYISTAVQDQGFQWMTNASKPLVIIWQNHFRNYVHENGKYLNRILPLKKQIVQDPPIYKQVIQGNDDKYGRRRTAAIPNLRGVVRFEWTHAVNKTGGITQQTPPNWDDISGLNTTLHLPQENVTSGSTVTIWVRARDILDNKKVDSTSVTYDFTEPQFSKMTFLRNEISNIPFSSGLELTVQDLESGIEHAEVKVTQMDDGHVMTNKTLTVPSVSMYACLNKPSSCYCPKALNVCYKRVYKLYISNCWLMVAKEDLESAHVKLEVVVVNRAGLKTPIPRVHVVQDLMDINGTSAYFGPVNVNVEKLTDTTANVSWTHAPSCHDRTFISVTYQLDSGKPETIQLYKDATFHLLKGLEPGKKYKVMVTADYGDIKSKPRNASFTMAFSGDTSGLGAGAKVGIVVVVIIILAVLVIGLFMWRTGKMVALINRRQSRHKGRQNPNTENIYNNLQRPRKGTVSYHNKTYEVDDDIYVYGSMSFTAEQPWYIPKDNLTLMKEINTGRFARIYRASHKTGKTSSEMAAKVLKETPDEENSLLMMAKINFAATQVGEHRNVLGFRGAILNNDALGPVMVLEYCENGQMDKWLRDHRDNVNVDTLERIQNFGLGIARGMEYLAKKGITHRKLAARNCLLTFTNEVKVSGFGPCRMEDATEDDNSKGDRIPVKWTAPECLQSLKGANEKSDIWSFGITMWEIFSMGKAPYSDIRSRDLAVKIRNGFRLQRPEFAEDIHHNLMKTCWEQSPDKRPTFADVLGKLEASFGLRPTSGDVYYYAR
ncbi:angiopoietin-1 receptor-like isoform X1 [Haliotis rufescens]|uniref:angiopoietin-1 receptor-like isoform X1 n=1 Tax=Haliotis rufescens TaxID=6454 RepID=UPI00201E756B|nr:angiopoietin-1 receptor-like isoform X1 [Haliotis rufescens]